MYNLYNSLKVIGSLHLIQKLKKRERRLYNLIKCTQNDKTLVLHKISRKDYLYYLSEDILFSED